MFAIMLCHAMCYYVKMLRPFGYFASNLYVSSLQSYYIPEQISYVFNPTLLPSFAIFEQGE